MAGRVCVSGEFVRAHTHDDLAEILAGEQADQRIRRIGQIGDHVLERLHVALRAPLAPRFQERRIAGRISVRKSFVASAPTGRAFRMILRFAALLCGMGTFVKKWTCNVHDRINVGQP